MEDLHDDVPLDGSGEEMNNILGTIAIIEGVIGAIVVGLILLLIS